MHVRVVVDGLDALAPPRAPVGRVGVWMDAVARKQKGVVAGCVAWLEDLEQVGVGKDLARKLDIKAGATVLLKSESDQTALVVGIFACPALAPLFAHLAASPTESLLSLESREKRKQKQQKEEAYSCTHVHRSLRLGLRGCVACVPICAAQLHTSIGRPVH